jgi:Zn-finger nucleic acid-binding protein
MQFPSHLNQIQEDIQQTQKNPLELTVKPGGEFAVKGSIPEDILDRIITSSDYHKDKQYRAEQQSRRDAKYHKDQQYRIEQQIQRDATITNIFTISFLGLTFLVLILCAYLSINKSTNQEHQNVKQHIRGTCVQQ